MPRETNCVHSFYQANIAKLETIYLEQVGLGVWVSTSFSKKIARVVGRLGSGLRLMGRIEQRGVYSDTTQLNSTQLKSTDPVEQRTAKSVVFLLMTS